MAETQLTNLARHDLTVVSAAARKRICAGVLASCADAVAPLVEEAFTLTNNGRSIPGIVRRSEEERPGEAAVGFVPLTRHLGQRLRIGTFAVIAEITAVITPYQLLQMEFAPRNICMEAVKNIAEWAEKQRLALGVLGSAGLEIYTGLPYTNANSDIDLLITGCSAAEIKDVYIYLQNLGRDYDIPIDLEVALTNGYGIKGAELFMETHTILGKGLKDVVLLDRREVMKLLG